MEIAAGGLLVVVFVVAFIVGGLIDERQKKKNFIRRLKKDYGKPSSKQYPDGRLKTVKGYAMRKKDGFLLDDITWNDLDMDKVFQKLDFSYSAAGEEYLYAMLRSPKFDTDSFDELEKFVTYFMEHEEERIQLQTVFARIGRTGKYSIFDYLDNLDTIQVKSNLKHYLGLAGVVVSGLLCFYEMELGFSLFFIFCMVNIMGYFSEKSRIVPYLTTFSYLLRLLESVKEFHSLHMEILEEDVKVMEKCRGNCRKFYQGSYLVTSMNQASSNPAEFIWDYLKMITHLDLIKFNYMLKEAKRCNKEFVQIFEITGKLESYISIGAYRKSVEYYTIPKFDTKYNHIETEEMYHPLISQPVANSFAEKRGMLLTGSNASGKSTFLKMTAINAILAQTVHTVLAKSYSASMFRVYTSMALRDDLEQGDSYFIVEIKALKRIFDVASKDNSPILCFVDEVLRGTNTVERIAASCEILENLSGQQFMCFAATHDIELTELLQDTYDNYHFEETIENDDIFFNYRLMKGKARTRNAIKLLGILGFEEKIIDKANNRAEEFVTKGVWTR